MNSIVNEVRRVMLQQGFVVYTKPLQLNIVGIRSATTVPNSFDDRIVVFWKDDSNQWQWHDGAATTDPGTYWLRNPMNAQGTAMLAAGQYIDSHELGLHRGQYAALVQRGPLDIFRDYDRDAVLDFGIGRAIRGLFGINIHRSSGVGTAKTVDKYSAGCQVWASIDRYNTFIELCRRHRDLHGNKFTYTLIDRRMIERQNRRKLAMRTVGGLAAAGVGYALFKLLA